MGRREYSEVRYLTAKRTVDDRALNARVASALPELLLPRIERKLRVLELGAGVGTMFTRFWEWALEGRGALAVGDGPWLWDAGIEEVEYTLLDRDHEALLVARERLGRFLGQEPDATLQPLESVRSGVRVQLRFRHGDILETLREHDQVERYDLVLANAVLDLLELRPALSLVQRALVPLCPFWFTINFDGETILLPEDPLDVRVMRAYHRTMDERVAQGQPRGDSKTGRHLLALIPEVGAQLCAAGSSDWVVFPQDAQYPDDEAHFLRHIVHTIEVALRGAAEFGPELSQWVDARTQQIENGSLIYVAHQLDVVGIRSRAGASCRE